MAARRSPVCSAFLGAREKELKYMKPLAVAGMIALAAAVCLDCADTNFDPGSPTIGSDTDADGDGYTADVDCDDNDPDIYPGAKERINCIDDNCDGEVDEGTSNYDKDHDGYCPSTGDIGDCEGNAKRHPGASEDGGNGSKKPNGIDDDCDGVIDEGLPTSDIDKDGFTVADGDCNDSDPYINPGAIEVEGMTCDKDADCPSAKCKSGYCRCTATKDCSSSTACTKDSECKFAGESCVNKKCTTTFTCLSAVSGMGDATLNVCRDNTDNDCDKKIDELPTSCDDPAKLSQTDAGDYAKAMELCETDYTCGVDGKCPGDLKCSSGKCLRVLSASFNAGSDKRSRAIDSHFAKSGPFTPKAGKSFVILSTGLAQYDPKVTCPQSGTEFTNQGADPDSKASDKIAYDLSQLSLEVLVPTNAQSFSFNFHFFSTEYPEYVESVYNDTFWVQLNSKKYNGNISFDSKGVAIRISNAFFSICDVDPCLSVTSGMCTSAASTLSGTGYDSDCGGSSYGCYNTCSTTAACGGSTGWLTTTSPVTPGEKIKLTFSIFDKGDHILDSAVLIDNFKWKLTPAQNPKTGPD
jgi:hypothetical protein